MLLGVATPGYATIRTRRHPRARRSWSVRNHRAPGPGVTPAGVSSGTLGSRLPVDSGVLGTGEEVGLYS